MISTDREWKCRACCNSVQAGLTECNACNCPAYISAVNLERWNVSEGYLEPVKPTIFGGGEFKPSAFCPNCHLLMYIESRTCPHCRHKVTDQQHEYQLHHSHTNLSKGVKLGAIFFIAFILLFVIVLK